MTPDYTGEPRSAGRTLTPRAAFWCALSIWVLTLATAGGTLIYNHLYPLPPALQAGMGNAANGVAGVMFIGGFATVGALLIWKRPANPIGWLMSATGLCFVLGTTGVLLLQFPEHRAWGNWTGSLFLLSIGFAVFALLLFPTGSLPSRRWRPVAWAAGVAAVISLVFRYRRASTVEREQLKWLVYAGGLIVAAALATAPIEKLLGPGSSAANNLENAVTTGTVALVPVAIGIAIFRYHLYDIDVVINKTLVYGSLAVFITGVYVAIVVGIGSLAQRGARPSLALSIAATAVVAIAFQPV